MFSLDNKFVHWSVEGDGYLTASEQDSTKAKLSMTKV